MNLNKENRDDGDDDENVTVETSITISPMNFGLYALMNVSAIWTIQMQRLENKLKLFAGLKSMLVKENLKIFYRGGLASLFGFMTITSG